MFQIDKMLYKFKKTNMILKNNIHGIKITDIVT